MVQPKYDLSNINIRCKIEEIIANPSLLDRQESESKYNARER